jgi:CheY-like chemotaxis protein
LQLNGTALAECRYGEPMTNTKFGVLVAPVDISRELRVLVVEDNPVNRLYAEGALQHLGHQPDLANDGQKALDRILSGARYDLVLMDCNMPNVDGFQATRRIREHEQQMHLPRQFIVAVTASTMAAVQRRCVTCGMDDVLLKPFEIDELRQVLRRLSNAESSALPCHVCGAS